MATAQEIRDWFAANPGASDAQIAQAMQTNRVSSDAVAAALGVDPGMVAQRYAAATAPAPAWRLESSGGLLNARRAGQTDDQYYGAVAMAANKWLANPGTAAEAFDAMSKAGISVSDLRNAGITQSTIDNALTVPTDPVQLVTNTTALNSMTSNLAKNPLMAAEIGRTGLETIYKNARGYVSALQQGGLTDEERNRLRDAAAGQGWSFADIRAAGLDPTLLFKAPEVKKPPVPPGTVTDVFPLPVPYTPVTVYDPNKFVRENAGADLYARGKPALDTAFRESPVRTVSPVTGQYMYTPAAKLQPATGAGWSWTPPVVTSRPRELLDVGPTASASQLYAQGRSAQDRALRNAFASRSLPMSTANTYYWQSRLRGGDYSPGGRFDPNAFQADFDTWSANLPPSGGGTPTVSTTEKLQPQMFLNMQPPEPQLFAEGGEATASRRMLEQIKKDDGTGADASSAGVDRLLSDPGMLGKIARMMVASNKGLSSTTDYLFGDTPVWQAKKYAEEMSKQSFPDDSSWGGQADALRHILFQSELTDRLGENWAKGVGLANEYVLGLGASVPDREMDVANDALGRDIGLSGGTQEERLQRALDAVNSGKARLLTEREKGFADGGEVSTEEQTNSRSMLQKLLSLDTPQDMTAGETAADIAAGFLPVVGTAQGARDFERARREGDMLGMGLSAASMVPVVGGAVRAARRGAKVAGALPANSAERLANLERFMAGSKAPPVLYTGTSKDADFDYMKVPRNGAWFSTSPKEASMYAMENDSRGARHVPGTFRFEEVNTSSRVLPVHLSAKNPYVVSDVGAFNKQIFELGGENYRRGQGILFDKLRQQGYDSVQLLGKGGDDVWVALSSPTQVKSAIGNSGNYSEVDKVLTKKDGGEVSTEELIAQMDRIGATPNAKTPDDSRGAYDLLVEAERRAANKPDRVRTESRGLLDRLNAGVLENVTEPVAGSLVDMTVGLGDFGQMATKYLAGRTRGPLAQRLLGADPIKGVETEPYTPMAPRVREALGLSGYDPEHPVAVGTQIAMPALRAATTVGRAANAANALQMAARAPRPHPGSAKELMERVGGEAAREGQIYVGSELGAQTAREIAPDNMMAEMVGAMIGGTAVNTAQNLDPRTVNNVAQAQMASYTPYPFVRGREYPFVGRLDQYVADKIEGTLTKDQFLGQIRPKFREYDILRAERALSDLGGKDKLTAADLLTRLEQVYDPADYKVSFYTTTEIPYKSYEYDDPWKRGVSGTSSTGRVGAIVLTRGGVEGEVTSASSLHPNRLNQGLDTLRSLTQDRGNSGIALELAQNNSKVGRISILRDVVNDLPDSTQQRRLRYYISDLEDAVGDRQSIAQGLDLLQEDKEFLLQSALKPRYFEKAYREAQERGGAPPNQLLQQAFDTALSRAYGDQMQYLQGYNEFFPINLDLTGAVSYNDKVQAIASQIGPAAARAKQQLTADTQNKIDKTLTSMEGYMPEFEKLFAPVATKSLPLGSNRGVKITTLHTGIPGNENPIGFSRFTEVMTTLPGATQPARGVYLHEMQSDLLKPLRKQGAPRSASEDQLRELIQQQRDIEAAKTAQIKTLEDSLVPLREQVRSGAMTYEEFVNSPVVAEANATIPRLDIEKLKARSRAFSLQESLGKGPSALPVDVAFPGMERNSKALQQLLIKNAVAGAIDQGYSFVALTAPTQSREPQLYQRIPQNASDVVKDLGEGFQVVNLTLEGNGGPFKTTAIVWGNDAEGREGVNRVLTRGVPFAQGGEVTSKPDDIKNLLSFLDK